MTPKELRGLKARLEALRGAMIASGPAKIEPTRTDTSSVGVPDEDAQALAEMLQVLASTRNKAQSAALGRIEAALRRLAADPDDFGLCEECEEPIAEARLRLMPYATRCTACQAEVDPQRGRRRRSLVDTE